MHLNSLWGCGLCEGPNANPEFITRSFNCSYYVSTVHSVGKLLLEMLPTVLDDLVVFPQINRGNMMNSVPN